MWEEITDLVQTAMSVAAIIIAIWTVRQQANRERDNRVIDDAAFASYVKHFLTTETQEKLEEIASPTTPVWSDETLAQTAGTAVDRYRREVMGPLAALKDLPLTDWPDIEFANAFSNVFLRMQADLDELEASASQASRDEGERQRHEELDARAFERQQAAEDERLEEEAVADWGDRDDGRSVALPPVGQRRRARERQQWLEAADGAPFETLEELRARGRDERRDWSRLYSMQDRALARDALRETLLLQLTAIAHEWAKEGGDLRRAIDRYIDRARRYNLPTTYEARAQRPRRLMPIFR